MRKSFGLAWIESRRWVRQLVSRGSLITVTVVACFGLTGCTSADQPSLQSSLDRYAELSTRQATANWPVEFGEVLSGEALASAEAGYLLLADAGLSQAGDIVFRDLEILAPGEAIACLDLSRSRIVDESAVIAAGAPSEQVKLGFHRLGGTVRISSFELIGAGC